MGSYSFRNAPHFMPFWRPVNTRGGASYYVQPQFRHAAEFETEALLDHLFWHPNVAPFIAHRLIQRLTTSNPSPRYVKAVSEAFRAVHGVPLAFLSQVLNQPATHFY